jgi:hypothetical protein
MIRTVETYFASLLAHASAGERPLETVTRILGTARAPGFVMPQGQTGKLRAVARVNLSRWIADCPVCSGGAEIVTPSDPRFFCLSCMHLGSVAQGKWLQVDFPAPRDRAAIEAELDRRPREINRNWFPWESSDDLAAETIVCLNGEERYNVVLAQRANQASSTEVDDLYARTAEVRGAWDDRAAAIMRARAAWHSGASA